jgi:hypothetical protein
VHPELRAIRKGNVMADDKSIRGRAIAAGSILIETAQVRYTTQGLDLLEGQLRQAARGVRQ